MPYQTPYGMPGLDADWLLLGLPFLVAVLFLWNYFSQLREWERERKRGAEVARFMTQDMDTSGFLTEK